MPKLRTCTQKRNSAGWNRVQGRKSLDQVTSVLHCSPRLPVPAKAWARDRWLLYPTSECALDVPQFHFWAFFSRLGRFFLLGIQINIFYKIPSMGWLYQEFYLLPMITFLNSILFLSNWLLDSAACRSKRHPEACVGQYRTLHFLHWNKAFPPLVLLLLKMVAKCV